MKRTDLIALADSMDADAKAHREAYAEDMSGSPITAKLLEDGSAILRQIAEAQPVEGAVYEDGGVSLIRRGTERDRCSRRGGELLYTLPLED